MISDGPCPDGCVSLPCDSMDTDEEDLQRSGAPADRQKSGTAEQYFSKIGCQSGTSSPGWRDESSSSSYTQHVSACYNLRDSQSLQNPNMRDVHGVIHCIMLYTEHGTRVYDLYI